MPNQILRYYEFEKNILQEMFSYVLKRLFELVYVVYVDRNKLFYIKFNINNIITCKPNINQKLYILAI